VLCRLGVVRRQSGRCQPDFAATLRLCRLGATGFDASTVGGHCAEPGGTHTPGFGIDPADDEVPKRFSLSKCGGSG